MNTEQTTNLTKTARWTGVLMLIMAVLAGFGMMYVPETLLAATAEGTIKAFEGLLRVGISANAAVFLIEIALVALLYKLLAPVNKNLSLMAAYARLAMTILQGVNLINLIFVLLITGSDFNTAFGTLQLNELVTLFLNTFNYISLIWGVSFGLHLVLSGYLVYKSDYFPRWIGILLIVLSVSYFMQSFGTILLPQYTEVLATIGLLAVIELAFPIWLVINGVKDPI